MSEALICHLCGGTLMDEPGDFYVCDSCGTKRPKKEVKKTVVEMTGSVKIDGKAIEDLRKNAETFVKLEKYEKALEVYKDIMERYPENYLGWYGIAKSYIFLDRNLNEILSNMQTAKKLLTDESKDIVYQECSENIQTLEAMGDYIKTYKFCKLIDVITSKQESTLKQIYASKLTAAVMMNLNQNVITDIYQELFSILDDQEKNGSLDTFLAQATDLHSSNETDKALKILSALIETFSLNSENIYPVAILYTQCLLELDNETEAERLVSTMLNTSHIDSKRLLEDITAYEKTASVETSLLCNQLLKQCFPTEYIGYYNLAKYETRDFTVPEIGFHAKQDFLKAKELIDQSGNHELMTICQKYFNLLNQTELEQKKNRNTKQLSKEDARLSTLKQQLADLKKQRTGKRGKAGPILAILILFYFVRLHSQYAKTMPQEGKQILFVIYLLIAIYFLCYIFRPIRRLKYRKSINAKKTEIEKLENEIATVKSENDKIETQIKSFM